MVAAACRRILEDHDASSAHYLSAARLHLPFPRDSFYQSVSLDGMYFRFNDGGSDSLAQKGAFSLPFRLLHDAEQINYLIEIGFSSSN